MFNDVWDLKQALQHRCFFLGYGEPDHDWKFLAMDNRILHAVDDIEPGYIIMGKWGVLRAFRISFDASFGWYWTEVKF